MAIFTRSTKPSHEAFDRNYISLIKVCYDPTVVQLSICGFGYHASLNGKRDFVDGDRTPTQEVDFKLKGFVDGPCVKDARVLCSINILFSRDKTSSLGSFMLTHVRRPQPGETQQEIPLMLDVWLRSCDNTWKDMFITALRDAALSGYAFISIELRDIQKAQEEIASITDSMRTRGFGPTWRFNELALWPQLLLPNSPAWLKDEFMKTM